MATVEMVWQELKSQITTAIAGTNTLLNNPAILPAPNVGIDWPAVETLQSLSVNQPPVISIFDRGVERNITRAIPLLNVLPPTGPTPGAIITVNDTYLPPEASITLTGSSIPVVNDAFCLTLISGIGGSNQLYADYIALATDTLSSALTAFTAKINLLDGIVASLSGSVITVTNNNPAIYTVRSEISNIATVYEEGYRWNRNVQVTLWTRNYQDRNRYGDVLEQLFSQLEVNYGFLTSDSSACRVMYVDDLMHKDSQLQDIYRRDFMLQINYPVLNAIPAWPIETIQQTYTD